MNSWGSMKPGAKITEDSQIKIGETVLFELDTIKQVIKITGRMGEYFLGKLVKGGKLIGDASIVSVHNFGTLYKPKGVKEKVMSNKIVDPMTIPNPLYENKKEIATTAPVTKEVAGAMVNDQYGMCPKCQETMQDANLGAADGKESVLYCPRCRVAEPKRTMTI